MGKEGADGVEGAFDVYLEAFPPVIIFGGGDGSGCAHPACVGDQDVDLTKGIGEVVECGVGGVFVGEVCGEVSDFGGAG